MVQGNENFTSKPRIIHDPIYGFIRISPVEWEIIHSPFYQRLRWIKQIGFSCYSFHGAEHSRFGHSIGVMFNAHKILESCGLAVTDTDLDNPAVRSPAKKFHQSIRLAALMHDLGTFPFSHTTEGAYIESGDGDKNNKRKDLQDNHEHLGSFIIKNTQYDSGITQILESHGFDPQEISDLVKGVSQSVLANQILHSEIDCDRMDYLLRDAHYTGLKYGSYDRQYLLHHFKVVNVGKEDILTIRVNALHCVEDFLMARFAWYSQVVRSARGSKYDVIAKMVTRQFLERGWMYKFSDLLEMAAKDPTKFYTFNDSYFLNLVHSKYLDGSLDKDPKLKDMCRCLLFEQSPKTLPCEEFDQRLLPQDNPDMTLKARRKAQEKVDEIQKVLAKKGGDEDWILPDIPQKNIIFIRSRNQIVKRKQSNNLLHERDPVKICDHDGSVKLLADVDRSIISRLGNTFNFVPNVFASTSAYNLLLEEGIIKDTGKLGY